MVDWYYMLVAFGLGLQVGDWVCERRWRKEKEAEFDRAMEARRAEFAKVAERGGK